VDRLAPLPAFASAWRIPDPVWNFAGFLPYLVLTELLVEGDASRLVQRLVLGDRVATSVGGHVGFMQDRYESQDPSRR
jgi:zinc protease